MSGSSVPTMPKRQAETPDRAHMSLFSSASGFRAATSGGDGASARSTVVAA
jgi:hypothetical protein